MKKFLFVSGFALCINLLSCRPDNSSVADNEEINIYPDTADLLKIEKNKTDSEPVLYIKSDALVFFALSDNEYKKFIHVTGEQSAYDFDLIYKTFKKTAKNTGKALKTCSDIRTVYTVNPVIAFITKSGDTLIFNRKDNDLFVGQIFFNGEDTLDVEEGLMKRDSLQNRIKKYFKLKEEIKIKPAVISYADNGTKIKKDTLVKQLVDTAKLN
ncbi:MAG: hypothetical protein GXO50_06840 [Chlorobi bacterium]|nr:hypothetical protein [Chlorobiota bacterium]